LFDLQTRNNISVIIATNFKEKHRLNNFLILITSENGAFMKLFIKYTLQH